MLILLPSFNVPYGFPGECLSISSHNTFRNTKPRRNLMTSSLHHVLHKPYTGESCPLIEQYFLVLNRKIYIILKSTRMLLCRILSQYVKQYHNRRVGSTNILDDYFYMNYDVLFENTNLKKSRIIFVIQKNELFHKTK